MQRYVKVVFCKTVVLHMMHHTAIGDIDFVEQSGTHTEITLRKGLKRKTHLKAIEELVVLSPHVFMVSSTANQICSETFRHASHFECYWKTVAVCIVLAMTRKAIVMATVEWPAVIEISGILVWFGGSMPGLCLHSRSESCNQNP